MHVPGLLSKNNTLLRKLGQKTQRRGWSREGGKTCTVKKYTAYQMTSSRHIWHLCQFEDYFHSLQYLVFNAILMQIIKCCQMPAFVLSLMFYFLLVLLSTPFQTIGTTVNAQNRIEKHVSIFSFYFLSGNDPPFRRAGRVTRGWENTGGGK